MSSPTWTAEELESNLVYLSGKAWRVVEGQHVVSTTKLVDTLKEQQRLEELLDDSKPKVPEVCQGLDYLLYTPFRYTPYKRGSRFRRAGQKDGAFYASENIHTALAEMAFYRLLFFAESPATPLPANPGEYTCFQIAYKSDRAIDLTEPPLNKNKKNWMSVSDYTACQNLADEARKSNITVIKSTSVRCPQRGINVTLLSCTAFLKKKPLETEQWSLIVKKDRVIAIKELKRESLSFTLDDFNNDPRIIKKS